jgi:hypothetical protein
VRPVFIAFGPYHRVGPQQLNALVDFMVAGIRTQN